jgi:hypothetical protein
MIRHNDATELCITKGQEGTVVGWQSKIGSQKQQMLDILFVQLVHPPTSVQINGLPINVVPITPMSHPAMCYLSDDTVITINRNQVNVLPNFGMTDFASQGKTRPDNPVDLNNCPHHQSIYTCLSRSSTAAGTVIVQGFDQGKITRGTTGFLRQELRELELLDEITKMSYEGSIPKSANVIGHCRNILINNFRQWKGASHVPSNIHPAITWSKSNPFPLAPSVNDVKWNLVDQHKKNSSNSQETQNISNFVPAKNTLNKHKCDETESIGNIKKLKLAPPVVENSQPPIGLTWDARNFSCAYDSLFIILYNIWSTDPRKWHNFFENANQYLSVLSKGFESHFCKSITLEDARDNVRELLHHRNPAMFPTGATYINITDLASTISAISQPFANTEYKCVNCNIVVLAQCGFTCFAELQRSALNIRHSDTVVKIFKRLLSLKSQKICSQCNGKMMKKTYLNDAPKLLILHLPYTEITIDLKIKLMRKTLSLRGIVYYGNYHYTSRIIDINRKVWFHDGMITGSSSQLEGSAVNVEERYFNKCNHKNVALLVYAQE